MIGVGGRRQGKFVLMRKKWWCSRGGEIVAKEYSHRILGKESKC